MATPHLEVLRGLLEPALHAAVGYTDRLAEESAVTSVGSRGDSYDHALAETINGPYRAELVHAEGPWRTVEALDLQRRRGCPGGTPAGCRAHSTGERRRTKLSPLSSGAITMPLRFVRKQCARSRGQQVVGAAQAVTYSQAAESPPNSGRSKAPREVANATAERERCDPGRRDDSAGSREPKGMRGGVDAPPK
jgi:hypothetical protein